MKGFGYLVTLIAITLFASTALADGQPRVLSTAGGTLDLKAQLSHGYVPSDETTEVYASISIEGDDVVTEDRAPLNVALVIDRSGSMSGGKIEQAKRAARELVDMLDERDRIAIVSYGSDVSVESKSLFVTPGNKERLHAAISRIRLRGSTNLAGGYKKGVDLIVPHKNQTTIDRVLLLSDGHANVGASSPSQLGAIARNGLQKGVTVTTMGIGLNYNEELMTAMAEKGAGNYYFIEKEKQIAGFFRKECHGLASTIARNTVLTVNVAPGVELLELRGFSYEAKGNKITVSLAEFFANQTKDILMKLAVSPQGAGQRKILKATLRFDDIGQNRRVSSNAELQAVGTSDGSKLKIAQDNVMERVQQAKVAHAMIDATKAYEKGDRDRARKILREQRKEMKDARTTYDFEDDAAFGRVDGELQEMEEEMSRSDSSSSSGKRLLKSKKKRVFDMRQSAESF